MPKVDVVLHCGDLTQVGGISAYKKALNLLSSFDAELKLVIAGNHDISLDNGYWQSHLDEGDEPQEHDEAVAVMTGPLARAAGMTYLTEGTHNFVLENGTTFSVFASPYQPECGDWAFGYPCSEDHFGQANIPNNVDIVMTHGPPAGILDLIPSKNKRAGCVSLLRAVETARPKLHCFGHIHEAYGYDVKSWSRQTSSAATEISLSVAKAGADEEAKTVMLKAGMETLMVNAAIMDQRNQPANAPWTVKMALGI